MNMENILNSLLIMGLGMLAIFVVLIVIYLAVLVLLKVGAPKKAKTPKQ